MDSTVIPGVCRVGTDRILAAWRGQTLDAWTVKDGPKTMDAQGLIRAAMTRPGLVMPDAGSFDRLVEAAGPLKPQARVLRLLATLPGASRAIAATRAVGSKHPSLEQLDATSQCRRLGIAPDTQVPEYFTRVLLVADMGRVFDEGVFTESQQPYVEEIRKAEDVMLAQAADPYQCFAAAQRIHAIWSAMWTADPGIRARALSDGVLTTMTVMRTQHGKVSGVARLPPRVRVGKDLVAVAGTGWPLRGMMEFRLLASKTTRSGFEIVVAPVGKLSLSVGQKLVLMEKPFLGRDFVPFSKWAKPSRGSRVGGRQVPEWVRS